MKKHVTILMALLSMMSFLMAQDSGSKRGESMTPSEIVGAFKKVLDTNDWARSDDVFKKMRQLKEDVLKAHKVHERLMQIVKSKDSNINFRRDSIELLLFYKAEGQKISNLESDLIAVMLDKNSGWYIQTVLMNLLPDSIDPQDNFSKEKMIDSMIKIIEFTPTASDTNRYIDVKRVAFNKLNTMGVNFARIKKVVLKELKDKNSPLKDGVIQYLVGYADRDSSFTDFEVKNHIRGVLTTNKGDYTTMQVANSILIYASIAVNEKAKVSASDEKMFIEFLQAPETPIIEASAKALYVIRSTDAVEPILNRLRELQSNERIRNELVVALIYLEEALLNSPEISKSRRTEALNKIKDVFINSLQQPSVKGPIRFLIYKAIDLYGLQHEASDFFKLDDLKKLIGIMSGIKDEKELLRITEVMSNLTSQYLGNNALAWEQWAVEEEKNTRSPFNRR